MEKYDEQGRQRDNGSPATTAESILVAAEQRESDIIVPDGGYGWVCTGCTFTINCFTWGMVSVSRLRSSFLVIEMRDILPLTDLGVRHMACTCPTISRQTSSQSRAHSTMRSSEVCRLERLW